MRRAKIARKLLALAGRDDVDVAAGIAGVAPGATRSPWAGHEGEGILDAGEEVLISSRDAVSLLIEAADGCELVTIGPQTNFAAAVARDPTFGARIARRTVMGGVFSPIVDAGRVLPPSIDHNLNCDPYGALQSLGVSIPTLYVPVDVTIRTTLTHAQVERLRMGDELCRALAHLIDVHPELGKPGTDRLAVTRAATLHDPLAVACTIDRTLVTVEEMPVTIAIHDGRARTFVDPLEGVPAEVVTSVDGEAFAELWLSVVLG